MVKNEWTWQDHCFSLSSSSNLSVVLFQMPERCYKKNLTKIVNLVLPTVSRSFLIKEISVEPLEVRWRQATGESSDKLKQEFHN